FPYDEVRARTLVDQHRRSFTRHLPDIGREPVAISPDRFYILLGAVAIAQAFPQERDVLVQIVLLDESIRPNHGDQVVFLNDTAIVLDENDKDVKSLGRECNRTFVTQELPLGWKEPEVAELVVRR